MRGGPSTEPRIAAQGHLMLLSIAVPAAWSRFVLHHFGHPHNLLEGILYLGVTALFVVVIVWVFRHER